MKKLKDSIIEAKWGNKSIELGKVYTYKDIPPFKTPTQIKEDQLEEGHMTINDFNRMLGGFFSEMSSNYKYLDDDTKPLVKKALILLNDAWKKESDAHGATFQKPKLKL